MANGPTLQALLDGLDIAAANLVKLERVWTRAESHIPTGPSRGSSAEYEALRRSWTSLLEGLPMIHGWTVTAELPDIDAAGQAFLDYWEIGEPDFDLRRELDEPKMQLDEYRFKLGRARRSAIRSRLEELTISIENALRLVDDLPTDGGRDMPEQSSRLFTASLGEIERLLGDTVDRTGRWGDLARHLRFGQNHDWHDIAEHDWPSVRGDIAQASYADDEPLPAPNLDLGLASEARPQGGVSTRFDWSLLTDEDFERLLFDLLRGLTGYRNVQWLMNTHAPDLGRDLSPERSIEDSGGVWRIE